MRAPESAPEAAAAAGAKPPINVPLWLLTLITFSGTLAMHIFVPALPRAGADLGASVASMQATISLYILGLAVGQLAYGPLSDRFGRRPVLMGALTLYTAAGLVAAFAPDAQSLIAARLFQALGGCAGLVLGRAIVRDTSAPRETARRLALMNLMVTLGPGLAPLAGSLLTIGFGWRSIFFALTALGVLNFLLVWRLLPETAALGSNTDVRTLARHCGQLITAPAFVAYCVAGSAATTSMYAFIAAAPFIFMHQLNSTEFEVGIYLGITVVGIWLGSMTTSRLILRVAVEKLGVRANMLSTVAAFILLAAVLSGNLSIPLVVGCMFFFMMGAGMSAPPTMTQALSVSPHVIGSASGLFGFAQMAYGAISTAAAGLGSDPAFAAIMVLAVSCVLAQGAFWFAARQRPRAT